MNASRLKFGDFELDAVGYELSRCGRSVKLERIPMELLLLLVDRRGKLVTRDEILQKLWGKDVFLDVDNSINTAISKIRVVLKDDPEAPAFIKTISGKGYRFIAPITVLPERKDASSQSTEQEHASVSPLIAPVSDAAPATGAAKADWPPRASKSQSKRGGGWLWPSIAGVMRGYRFVASVQGVEAAPTIPAGDETGSRLIALVPKSPITLAMWRIALPLMVVVLLTAITVGGMLWRARQTRQLVEKDQIVLADFTNNTGDPVFDDALQLGLRVQLEQSPFLNVLSDQRVSEELRLMERSSDGRLTVKVAREVCERKGAKAVLAGSISKLGNHYAVGLNAVNCRSGDSLANEQVEVDTLEHVLKALSQSAAKMREKLGESLSSIEKYDTPLEEATTPSLEALQAYSLGVKAARTTGNPIPFFQRAVQLDSNFAIAYALLGSFGQPASAAENFRKAYELRGKVSDSERFYIDSHYYERVLGNLEKARQEYELWQHIYPRDDTTYTDLAAIYSLFGKYEAALEQAREAVRLHPEDLGNRIVLGYTLTFLERRDEAESVFKWVAERDPNSVFLELYLLAFLRGDSAEMERLARTVGPDNYTLLAQQAAVEAYHGRLKRARKLFLKSVEYSTRSDDPDMAAAYLASLGIVEAYLADPKHARADSRAAMSLNLDFTTLVAGSRLRRTGTNPLLAMALAGDSTGAGKLAAQLNSRFPQSTVVQRSYLPVFRAAEALQRRDPGKALSLLQEFMTPGEGVLPDMHATYLCGQAYLLLHDGSAAAVQFQKIIDHPGIVVLNPFALLPLRSMSRLELARAYALQGDTAKARTAYQDFLTVWKDADTDIPILREAKAEYASLK